MKKTIYLSILLAAIVLGACKLQKISYSFTGGTIPTEAKTFSVDYFSNKAEIVVPYLSSMFTEELKDKMRNQTSLNEVTEGDGDLHFEGQITGYSIRPVNIQRDEVAASNRLTITVRVKYTNPYDDKLSFDSSFSHYYDYDNSVDFTSVEETAIKEIIEKIIDDIYNKAFINW